MIAETIDPNAKYGNENGNENEKAKGERKKGTARGDYRFDRNRNGKQTTPQRRAEREGKNRRLD